MSPMHSTDRCMNAALFGDCEGPSYWTTNPTLRLCALCFRARFGCDPILVPGEQRAAGDSRRVPARVHAQGAEDAGRDGGPPAPTTRAAA